METSCFDMGFETMVSLSLPLSIQIEITEACNLKCPFCYNDSGIKNNNVIPINRWKKMLFELKEAGGVFQCAFSGGEPLLFKDEILCLMDIMHGDNTGLILITNAFFLDQLFIDKLCRYNWYWIQVSLDSYKATTHDSLRGIVGCFDKAIQAIKNLKKCGLPVAISSVICNKNIDDINGIIQLACELNVDSVLFSQVLPVGRTVENSYLGLNQTQKIKYCLEIEKANKIFSSQILIKSAQSYEDQIRNINLEPPLGLVIRPNGDVKTDCLSPKIVGNAFETSISNVWRQIIEERRWVINDKESLS